MGRRKNKRRRLISPGPQKTIPTHWPGNQPPQPAQPFIGPLPPKDYKEQNCLPEAWTAQHEKIHRLLREKKVDDLLHLLDKFLRIKKGGYKEAPQDITDIHIEVARYILKNNYGQNI